MRDGSLPDLSALETHILGLRLGATLRGVEATVDGLLEEHAGKVCVRVPATGALIRLDRLRRKIQVQWDLRTRKKQKCLLQDSEREAYQALVRQWTRQPCAVRVVGPLVKHDHKQLPGTTLVLQVRQFQFNPLSTDE